MFDLIHSAWGAAHTGAAVIALILGPVLFLRVKGGKSHRQLGYAYVAAMLVVCLAGLPMRGFMGTISPFHVLAIVSLVTVTAGLIGALVSANSRSGRPGMVHAHMKFMAWSYIGLVAAGLAQIGTRVAAGYGVGGLEIGVTIAGVSVATCFIGAALINGSAKSLLARYAPDATPQGSAT